MSKTLDKQIDKIREEIKKRDKDIVDWVLDESRLQTELDNLKSEIRNIRDNIDNAEDEKQDLLKDIEELKYLELVKSRSELTGDPFIDSFINASGFASKENRGVLQYVKILEDKLMAIDGYKGVIIKCDIPEEFKNTFIKWDIRDNYKENSFSSKDLLSKQIAAESFFKLEEFMETAKADTNTIETNKEEFYEKYLKDKKRKDSRNEDVFKFGDTVVAINEEFMETALQLFDDFELSFGKRSINPILLKDKTTEVVIMPIKLETGYELTE